MGTILLVGEDQLLLQTRAAVLQTTGAETICCHPSSAFTIQAKQNCDLIMLCHSMSARLCGELAEAIHSRWPNVRLLQLVPTMAWEQLELTDGVVAISTADPVRLIDRTIELLGLRGPASVRCPPGEVALRSNSLHERRSY
jgi:hypothetical protein